MNKYQHTGQPPDIVNREKKPYRGLWGSSPRKLLISETIFLDFSEFMD